MTQILLYRCEHGLTLATDSRAVVFGSAEGAPEHLEVQKLFPLSPEVIAVTGGAGFGVLLCRKYQRYIAQAGLKSFDEIAESAQGFFRAETDSYRRKTPFTQIRPDLDRVYIVLAGYAPCGGDTPFPFILLASENREDPMHCVEAPNILAIPRQVSIEYRLTHLSPSKDTLQEVASLFERFLMKLAESDDDVGPPFHIVQIDSEGIVTKSV